MERDTTKYIVLRVLPSDPALAKSLLTALLRSNPSSLRTIRRLLERQGSVLRRDYDTMDDIRLKRRDMLSFLTHIDNNNNNKNDNDDDNINNRNKYNVAYDNEDGDSAADDDGKAGSVATEDVRDSVPARRMRISSLWKPSRGSMMASKRSLGRCIHECINGKGNMNFIQCKSMCH